MTGKSVEGSFHVVPKLFTYGDRIYLAVENDDNGFDIYNDDIERVKRIAISGIAISGGTYTSKWEEQERKAEAGLTKVEVYQETYEAMTLNKVREEYAGNYIEHEGYEFWPSQEGNYFCPELCGKQYPLQFYRWEPNDGCIYLHQHEYRLTYTGEWETVSEGSSEGESGVMSFDFQDYDEASYTDRSFSLSQTLFNDDEKFEYIVPAYGELTTYIYGGYDRDGDGEIDHRTVQQSNAMVGFKVVSEDGTTLQTVTFEDGGNGEIESVMRLNGKYYLVVYVYGSDSYVFYKIDRQATSVSRVNAMPAAVTARYSLDGQRLTTPRRGVNIVRRSDGKTEKILVK